jgi:orotate phosphoribosyltransferase
MNSESRAHEVEAALLHIGAVQFGQFENPAQPGNFEPVRIHLPLLASYPETLAALALALVPLARLDGASHLLAMPGALPIAFALSLESGLPLVYPAAGDPDRLEGAFDYNVPTLLITDVLAQGRDEAAMIRHVHRHGLDVEGLLAVYDLGLCGAFRGPHKVFAARSLWQPADVLRLAEACSATLGVAVSAWLAELKSRALAADGAQPTG